MIKMQKISDIKQLGVLLHEVRKEQGLTQEQLAAVCGVGVRFVRELEHGKATCHIGKVLHVLRILGIEVFARKQGESGS
jgi:y4mF family transcriptional regulator